MSDRHQLFEQTTQPKSFPNNDETTAITLWQDNDSGTWRLFLKPSLKCVDLSLQELREFAAKLNEAVAAIETDEWKNAEFVRDEYARMDV